MTRNYKTATVFGGTGFVGSLVVRELAKRSIRIKVATRVPESAYFLKPAGSVGQVVPFACNYRDPASIALAVSGSDYVVNCVGILAEKKKGDFTRIHTDLPAEIAKACKNEGVKRLVHISALGIEDSTSRYAQTKLEGEKLLHKNFKTATILRPSVIFGEGDSFFNMFAEMARYLPALPLIGGGWTRFQPVFAGDVADAAMAALEREDTPGNIYELGGPEILNFREIYQRLFKFTGRQRKLVKIPFCMAKIQAFFMGVIPNPPLTRDQVESLKTDNVVSQKALNLEDLDIHPTALDLILPLYLETYRAGGRFAA